MLYPRQRVVHRDKGEWHCTHANFVKFWNELKIDISRLVSHLSKMLAAAIDSTTMLSLSSAAGLFIGYTLIKIQKKVFIYVLFCIARFHDWITREWEIKLLLLLLLWSAKVVPFLENISWFLSWFSLFVSFQNLNHIWKVANQFVKFLYLLVLLTYLIVFIYW